MSEESGRFRDRAKQCRDLSKGARSAVDREALEHMADDLDAEADKIEEEDAAKGDT